MLPMMNTFNDKRYMDPHAFCPPQIIQTVANDSTNTFARPVVQMDPWTYDRLIRTIIILSIIIILLLMYIVWNCCTSRKHGKQDATKGHSPDIERGTKAYPRTPETPDTVVGIDNSKHLHMNSRDTNSSQDSYYKGAPFKFFVSSPDTMKTLVGQPVSAFDVDDDDDDKGGGVSRQALEMNVGDKLRSHPMVRETTGNIPLPAETERNEYLVSTSTTTPNTTLGLEGHGPGQRCHSRSSLYTIAEAETEASSTISQEPTSPIVTAVSSGLTHVGLATVPL